MDSKKKEKDKDKDKEKEKVEKDKEKDLIVYEKDVDMTSAARGIWLVKVPKYISNRWEKAPGNIECGKLRISKVSGQKPNVSLSLSEAIMVMQQKGEEEIPKDHKLIVSSITAQTLGVFSQQTVPSGKDSALEVEKLIMEGRITQKLDCRPIANASYMKLKRETLLKASQPVRVVKQIDRVVQSYKPISEHKHNVEFEEKKKAEGKKARDDKDKVLEMLFAAFEKHQYYNIKDLVRITRQPITYLKEILKEVGNYNVKSPHKNTWELKPEYRHYKSDDN